jgi:crossover junction endodeoxyribonuclease RusA
MSPEQVEFRVPGKPIPQGGMTAFNRGNKVTVAHKRPKELMNWRALVTLTAAKHFPQPITGAVRLDVAFMLTRPKSHYGSGRNSDVVRPTAPVYPTVSPDIDKILRALLDSLSTIAFVDDKQVIHVNVTKQYVYPGDAPSTWVRVTPLSEEAA